MLKIMQVIIGKAKVILSEEKKISPGNLPNGNFFKRGYASPIKTIIKPVSIINFCIDCIILKF